jgi:beta-glucosidase
MVIVNKFKAPTLVRGACQQRKGMRNAARSGPWFASLTSTLAILVALAPLGSVARAQPLAWMDTALTPEQRTPLLVRAMTLDEKLEQMLGTPGVVPELPQCYGGRHVNGIPRLQIPTLRVTNGPVGIGQNDCVPLDTPGLPLSSLTNTNSAPATAIPSALAVAASFDPTVAAQFGNVVGTEARNLALHVFEAPGMNLARVPQGGRNFEYMGEDPLLTGTLAVSEIDAVQSHGVIAMAKHFVANEQETNRLTIEEIIDDRTLHELYLLPFEMAVKDGQVAAAMCSYNSVNGPSMCENTHLLTDVLRGQFGFPGYVQSDFFAAHDVTATLLAGMDLEMPGLTVNSPPTVGPYDTPANLSAAIANGRLTVATIDTALSRRYTQMFRLGVFDRPVAQTPIDAVADGAIARAIGEQSAVLLKNTKHILPLRIESIHSIAVIGQAPYASIAVSGCCGGSSDVIPLYTVTPVQGLQNAVQALGSSASVNLTLVDTANSNLTQAVAAAAAADAVIVMAGAITEEGADRPNLSLPNNQDALISAVLAANARTIVVLKDGGPVLMPWIDQAPTILEAWFPGEEDGNIVADLLFGLANPSGKLPVTYPQAEEDVPAHTPEQWPGVSVNGVPTVTYSEGLEVGYRWYDAQGIKPLFPFGYGLSYTKFSISNLNVSPKTTDGRTPITVEVTVRNTGSVRGAEVPQVYLGLPSQSGEPPKRLVAFQKVWLDPGEKRTVQFVIDPGANSHPLGYWDSSAQQWAIIDGDCQVYVGTSATDLRHSKIITLR